MTQEELSKIPFHFVCSLAMEDKHILSYESEDGRLGFCDHTRKCKNGGFGKSFRHWRIEDKVYKNKDKFIEALADFNPKVINIKDKPYKNTIARMKHGLATTTSSTAGKTPPHKQ